MDRHHAMLGIPVVEHPLYDTQAEHSHRAAKVLAGLNGRSIQLEFPPRISPQVVRLRRPCHGTDEQLALDDVRLDGADARGSVAAQRAQQCHPRGVQAGRA